MADKSISELTEATSIGVTDLFVLEQNNTAKKLTGQILENWLLQLSQGHGGISLISKTKTVGVVDTYTITYVDGTSTTFTVTNGNGIANITKTSSGLIDTYTISYTNGGAYQFSLKNGKEITSVAKTSSSGLVDTYTITYSDGNTSTFTITNGAKGDTGDTWYTSVRWAAKMPTSDDDMETVADDFIGFYSGEKEVSELHYTDFEWYRYKGDKGDTGEASSVSSTEVVYGVTESQSSAPAAWYSTMPQVAGGHYLWTRTTITFNNSSIVTFYSKTRWGVDGSGSGTVTSVNGISPLSGDVPTLVFGTEDPTSSTEGYEKQLYVNVESNSMFICTGVEDGSIFHWELISAASNYELLSNKPIINGNTLNGSMTTESLGIKYEDLPDKPTIPTVNNGTLTIKRNGTSLGTFTANSSTNTNVDISVPTVNNATLTIKRNGTSLGTFTSNSATDTAVDISVPTVNDATLTITRNGTSIGTFSANSSTSKTINVEVPTVNNATLTIQKNGSSLGTFTSNASSDSTINVTVPTKVGELTNDSAYVSKLTFINTIVATTDFVEDSTYLAFPYRAAIALTGVTASMLPEVVMSPTLAMSGKYAPVAETYAGGVYIYTSEIPSVSITIPTIVCWKE